LISEFLSSEILGFTLK